MTRFNSPGTPREHSHTRTKRSMRSRTFLSSAGLATVALLGCVAVPAQHPGAADGPGTAASGARQPAGAASAEWPQWRGPSRDATSKEPGLLKEWPEAGPPLAWKATGLGAGHSSVSVAKGR